MSKPPPNTALVLTGPTGIGKTALSRALAGKYDLEIVSADSRQIYRYLDIGTAKPGREFRAEIPHHFIDMLNPDEEYSAGRYCSDARTTILEILSRGKLPLVVGGSGLYIRALTEGFFKTNKKEPELRRRLTRRLETEGSQPLYDELKQLDPEAAARVHPNNAHRVVRMLEMCLAAGGAISKIQQDNPDPAPFQSVKICLQMERQALYRRIEERTDEMFRNGLLDEVKAILDRGYDPGLQSLNSVGYKEVFSYLRNELDLSECIALVKRHTRQYAKRQVTWFKTEKHLHFLDKAAPEVLLPQVEMLLRNNTE